MQGRFKGEITQDWLFEGVCKKCEKPFSTKLNPEPLKATRGYSYNAHLLGRKGVYPYRVYGLVGSALTSHNFPPRRSSTASYQMSTSATRTMLMRKRSGTVFDCKTLGDYCDLYCCHRHSPAGRRLWDVPTDVSDDSTDSDHGPLLHHARGSLFGRPPEERQSVELELLTDYDQHLFIERGMRWSHLHGGKVPCKGQQPQSRGLLRSREADEPHPLPWCEQPVWVGDESIPSRQEVSSGWTPN